jgi:hypothetical protein
MLGITSLTAPAGGAECFMELAIGRALMILGIGKEVAATPHQMLTVPNAMTVSIFIEVLMVVVFTSMSLVHLGLNTHVWILGLR